ncbi:MAG: SH3 domain-containing protein [Hyphomicrobiaceae bacterium]|nr:SH3 domain-containing protein [Hyphomicrobiaceae bacterium]
MFRVWVVGSIAAMMAASPAKATTGWGCFRVVNVAVGDVLNMRAKPSVSATLVDRLVPGKHGVLAEAGACAPLNAPHSKQWCPIKHYSGNVTTTGWVRAIYLSPNQCP